MPLVPQPWNRKNRGWYVTLQGRQIPLGKDRDEAFRAYRRLLIAPVQQAPTDCLFTICHWRPSRKLPA